MLIALAFTSCQMNTDDSVVTPPAPTYTITVTATNGTVTLSKTEAKAGEKVTITATADSGYVFDNASSALSIPDCKVSDDKKSITWNLTMPEKDVTINVTFKAATPAPTTEATYTITVTYDKTNGSARVTNASGEVITSAKAGENVTLTVTPNSGYKFDATITINGQPETQTDSAERSYTMAMPSSNITVNVSFTQISNNNGGNGTGEAKDEAISDGNLDIAKAIMFSSSSGTDWGDVIVTNAKGQKIKSANAGAKITLTVKPKSGYELGHALTINKNVAIPGDDGGWFIVKDESTYIEVTCRDNGNITTRELTKVNDTTYTFVMPETNVTIQARFDPEGGYTVTSDRLFINNGIETGENFTETSIKVKPGEYFTVRFNTDINSIIIDGKNFSSYLKMSNVDRAVYSIPAHDVAVTTTLKNQQ